jgi:hypothetical protein
LNVLFPILTSFLPSSSNFHIDMEPINAKWKLNFDGYKPNPKIINLTFFGITKSKFWLFKIWITKFLFL